MSDWLPTIVMAIVQGITEFLPISSDGHLAVTGAVFAALGVTLADGFHLTVALHIGTLLAVFVFYRRQLVEMLLGKWRLIGLLIAGTIPTAVVGLIIHRVGKEYLDDPWLAGLFLIANGGLLLYGSRQAEGAADYDQITVWQAVGIGFCQAFAILPGVSRSCTTIVAGLVCGMRRPAAATFSFLLSIPAISGAVLLEFRPELARLFAGQPIAANPVQLALGISISFLVGLCAMAWLLRWLERGRLQYFAYWCFAMGIVVLTWQSLAGSLDHGLSQSPLERPAATALHAGPKRV